MHSVLINKASDLKPHTREVLESEFGRRFRDDEEVSIMAFLPHEAPTDEARREAAARLEQHFERMDERTADIPEEEVDEIVIEAMRSVRPGYQEPVRLAIAGKTDVLCTRDLDLFDDPVRAYAAEHGIRIMGDLELLAFLDELPPAQPARDRR
jgi:hypothetical protein